MFKKVILFLFLIMLICTGCGKNNSEDKVSTLDTIVKRGSVNIGVKTDIYPFGYIDKNGKNAGYDIDIAKEIGKGIFGEYGKVKFIPVTSSNRMMKLYSEEADMLIATMSVTSARTQILEFSDTYYMAGQSILVKNGSKIKSLRDLSGKKVIIVFGSTSERSLRGAVPNVGIIGYKTYDEAYKALKVGKADAIVSDDTILLGFALKDNSVKLLPKKYTKEPYAVAFRKGSESDELVKIVNQVIGNMRHDGTLRKLQKDYKIKKY